RFSRDWSSDECSSDLDCRDDHNGNLPLPAESQLGHERRNQRTYHYATREPHVELVEHGGFACVVNVGNQWVTGGLNRTIGKANKEAGQQQSPETSSRNRQEQAQQVTGK